MTRIVVDASVILASLISDGPTRGLLLGHHDLELYTPEVARDLIEGMGTVVPPGTLHALGIRVTLGKNPNHSRWPDFL